ncbi:helix-turn-helix domain-containing protein [Pseudothauera rhizosphaerae]|uniref:Helix-turn-helix domain-containing protein n=2 Tax=Pseudothauera rhizosphaerae TaxID=2565932 RepID=A0A4S4AIZ5_9RHOO|nr:helix-turn-helix domain-containing protein [Pseudothauera rhizosphaerae]
MEPERADAAAVGEILRGAREMHGLTVANVAQMLKLGSRQIEAMEAGRFDLLPGPAFARGFLRNYARQLGLDPEPLISVVGVEASASEAVELTPVSNAEGVMPVGGDRPTSPTPVAVVAFALLLVVLAGWYFDWFRTPAPVEVAMPLPAETAPLSEPAFPPPGTEEEGVPPATVEVVPTVPEAVVPAPGVTPPAPAAAPQPQAAPVPAPRLAEAPAAGETRVELRFSGESWYEVRDAAGSVLATGIGSAGQVRSVRGGAPLAVVIGNAGEVSLSHNGQPVDLAPHTRVSVARVTLR